MLTEQGQGPSACEPHGAAAHGGDVARVAYRRWTERGCPAGSDVKDWLDAERDLRNGVAETAARVEHAAGVENNAAAESDLADFLENAVMPLHWVAADGTILWANPAELELVGYPREEYVGCHVSKFHADEGVIADMLARLARGESLRNREARLRCKDGSVRHVLISSNVLWRGGAFVHTRCFTVDVTDRRRLEDTLRSSESWNRAILDSALDAILVTDEHGRIADLNRAAEAMFGSPRETALGGAIADLFAPSSRGAHRRRYEQALRDDEPTFRDRREFTALRRDGTEFPAEISIARLAGSDPPRFTGFVRDLTERKAAENRRAAEHAVVRALTESESSGDVAERILAALGPHLAWDVGAIWMLGPAASELRCACFWSRPDAGAPRFEDRSRTITLPRGIGLPGHVWDTGRPAWVMYPSDDATFPRREAAREEGLRSAFAFPICGPAGFLGVIEFLSREHREPDGDLLETMAHVGAQVGQFVERRRAEESLRGRRHELEVAREIQTRLLPRSPPVPACYAIAAASHPAQETGGDYYDYLWLPGEAIGIVIGDASGHGVGAALVIAETRAYLRAFAVLESDPGRLLARANRCLAEDLEDGFVTLFLARLDPAARSLTYSSAGHWPGYLFGGDGELKASLPSTGIPLGLDAGAEFPTSPEVRLEAGDLLLLLTDGVVEASPPDGELFGAARVFDVVRGRSVATPDALVATLFERVAAFDGGRVTDDRTAVLIEVLPCK